VLVEIAAHDVSRGTVDGRRTDRDAALYWTRDACVHGVTAETTTRAAAARGASGHQNCRPRPLPAASPPDILPHEPLPMGHRAPPASRPPASAAEVENEHTMTRLLKNSPAAPRACAILAALLALPACGSDAGSQDASPTASTASSNAGGGTPGGTAGTGGDTSTGTHTSTGSSQGGNGSTGTGGTSNCDNNPDGYPTSGDLFYANDYETNTLNGMWEAPLVELAWGANFGHDGSGAFRAVPQPFPSTSGDSPNEDHAGWGISEQQTPVDACRRVFISYLLYLSQDLLDDIADPPAAQGRAFWQAGNKIVDISQYNANGQGTDDENGFRYVLKLRRNNLDDSGRVQFSHLAGGAGIEYFDDGTNDNPDWRTLADQWVWVMHVLDEENTEMRTYVKRATDCPVQRALVRDGTFQGPDAGDFLQSHGRGFRVADMPLWGYWDDIVNATISDTKYVAIDRVRVSDHWIAPPF
jgi:hypothetical protein